MWQELAATLNELNKIYQQLIETGKRKHDVLVAIDMKALEGLLEEEKQLTQKISLLEQKRQKALIHLAVENRSIKQDTQMAAVLSLAPKELQPLLRQLSQEGLIRADAFGLGLDVDRRSRAIGREGRAVPNLLVSGPAARAHFGELMGLPQVADHAAAVAAEALLALGIKQSARCPAF